jgi:hypothetical protein
LKEDGGDDSCAFVAITLASAVSRLLVFDAIVLSGADTTRKETVRFSAFVSLRLAFFSGRWLEVIGERPGIGVRVLFFQLNSTHDQPK